MIDEYAEQRRFWCRVKPSYTGCWLWVGGTRTNGYGMFAVKNGTRWTQTTAHRFAYQVCVGAIPDGFEVDHLCRRRNCVRPEHLEAVTVAENRRRRDVKPGFDYPTTYEDLPNIPVKPVKPVKAARTDICPNGHEYAIVGKVLNGFGRNGVRRFTCAACRKLQSLAQRKNNAAADRQFCPQGHPYSGDNLIQKVKHRNGRPYNSRECRTCVRTRNRLAHKRTKVSVE